MRVHRRVARRAFKCSASCRYSLFSGPDELLREAPAASDARMRSNCNRSVIDGDCAGKKTQQAAWHTLQGRSLTCKKGRRHARGTPPPSPPPGRARRSSCARRARVRRGSAGCGGGNHHHHHHMRHSSYRQHHLSLTCTAQFRRLVPCSSGI